MMINVTMLTDLREKLHKCPELSLVEYKTADILIEFLSSLISGDKCFKIFRPFHTSIVVEYQNADKNSPYKLFRADMDALPIKESGKNKCVSENDGIMHACGHDVHMTILSGLIALTAEKKPENNLLFVFQPGEEGAGGAKKMLETGFFDSYKIESVYALHVTDDYAVGECASNGEILFAIPREIDVFFKGKSAHAAFPEKGNDALACAASFLSKVELVLSKSLNPSEIFLAHFGKISSGSARNVVSDHCKIEGTLRAFKPDVMSQGFKIVEETANTSALDFGCKAEISILGEYVEVKNNPVLFEKLKTVSQRNGIKCIEKKGELVGEDFGYFTKKWTGILFWLGSRDPENVPNSLHSQTFYPSDNAIQVGIKIMWGLMNFR